MRFFTAASLLRHIRRFAHSARNVVQPPSKQTSPSACFRIRSPPLATRVCPRAQGTHAAASGCPESLRSARLPPPGCGEERVTRLLQACVPLLLSARVTFAARVLLCRLGLPPMLPDPASISRHGCCWGGHPCCPHPALEPTGVSGCCGHPSCPRPALGRSTYQSWR